MNTKRARLGLPFAIGALVVAAAVAGPLAASSPSATESGGQREHLSTSADLDVFAGPFTPTSEQAAARDRLERSFSKAPADSMMASVDFRQARPMPIPGTSEHIWAAHTPDGGLCTFTPQPGGSPDQFSASCATLDEMNAVGKLSATYGDARKTDAVIVTVVEPDGVANPVIVKADGTSREFPLRSNIAVTTAEYEDAVHASGVTLKVLGPGPIGAPGDL